MTPAEIEETFRTHGPFLAKQAHRARRMTGRELDDCMQDVGIIFLASCRAWTPEGGANIRTFARRLIWQGTNAAKKRGRSRKRDGFTVSLDQDQGDEIGECTLHDVLGVESSQEKAVDELALCARVSRALAKLPPTEREVIVSRFYADETLAETGREVRRRTGTKQLGMGRAAVRLIEQRALERLRKYLASDAPCPTS